jgi:small subunit ribosomal protein S17
MPRRILQGQVVSDKMDKTVTVLVERRTMHPIYKKYVKQSSKYAAHDENNAFRIGDKVQIEECRPLSKRKSWKVITDPSTVQRSAEQAQAAEAAPKAAAKKAAAPKAKKKA